MDVRLRSQMDDITRGASPHRGGASSLSGALWCRVQCSHCGTWIPKPFARLRVAVADTHVRADNPHGPRCRVIVVPALVEGGKHEVHRVPDGSAIETMMQRVLEEIVRPAA